MSKPRILRLLKLLAKALVTLLLAWLVFRRIHLGDLASIIQRSKPAFLLAAVIIYFASFLASTVRSGLFLADAGIRLGFREGLRLYMLGVIGNLALPGGIGGDGYKILRLRKSYSVGARSIIKAYLLERISGLWAIGAWLAILSFWIPSLPYHGLPILSAFLAASACYIIALKKFFPVHTPGLAGKHLLSVGIQGLVSLSALCILTSQPSAFSSAPYLFGFHSATVVSILNIGLSGLGIREFVMGYSAEVLGNDPVLSVFTASAFWLVSTVAALPGLWVLWQEGLYPKDAEMEEES